MTRLLVSVSIFFFASLASPTRAAQRPNVLILLADDLGWADLACYGSTHTKTPHLDRLAKQGMRFTDFYAAAPNCSPSRAGLLTGRIPARTGLYSYISPDGPMNLPKSEITIAKILKAAGYQTAHFGKWHLCHDLQSPKLPQPHDHGFEYSLGTYNNAKPSHKDPVNYVRNTANAGKLEGYSCDLVVDEAAKWIDAARRRSAPFFACLWFHETHAPIASPPDLVKPHLARGLKPEDAEYNANVENLDRAIGRFLDRIDQMGLTRDTFLLFSSDNGALAPRSNCPLRGKKSFVYEGGIRVPAIIRWPGHIEPGSVSKEPAGLIDILPTLCQITNAPVPNDRPIDGASLVPLFNRKPIHRLSPLFWFFYRVQPAAALREGDWTIVGHLDSKVPKSHALSAEQMTWLKQAKLNKFELYNLREDLAQSHDRAAEEPQRFQRMRRQITDLHREVLAEGPTWNFPKN